MASYDQSQRRLSPAEVNRQHHRSTVDRQDDDENDNDEQWVVGRLPSTSRRYHVRTSPQGAEHYALHPTQVQAIPARRSAQQRMTEEVPRPAPSTRRRGGFFRSHPLLWMGVGMLVMLLAWTTLQALGSWWSLHQDDVTYGRPRTAQYDVVVGHNDGPGHPSHFVALNLNAQVVIIELPGGDISRAHIYQGPPLIGTDAALYPVTLTFPDPSGSGKPNMEVHVQGQMIVYLNTNGQFILQSSSH